MLVLKTVFYDSKFPDFENYASLDLELSESDMEFMEMFEKKLTNYMVQPHGSIEKL